MPLSAARSRASSVASAVGGRCRFRKSLRDRRDSALGLSLRPISIGKGADNRRLRLSRSVLTDLAVIAVDACAGLALASWLFATPASGWVVALGAIGATLPDPLQFAHSLFPREPLNTLQRFHAWVHARRKLAWKLGVSSQIAAVSALAGAMR